MKAKCIIKLLLLTVFYVFFFSKKMLGQVTIFTETIGNCCSTTNTPISSTTFDNTGLTFTGTADTRTSTVSTGYSGSSGGRNVFFTNTVGRDFIIEGIITTGYNSLTLSFGHYKSTTAANNELVVEVSSDGINWSSLTYSRATGTGTANWLLITPTGTIPATANLRIRFRQTSSTPQFRIDDIKLTGLSSACSTPTNQASSIIENYSCANAITLNWTIGNGSKRIVIMNTSNSFTSPANGSDPLANTSYSGSGEQVIYNSNGNSVNVSGLNSLTTYWFRIYEYNCSGSNTVYLNSTGTNNPQSISTPTITCPTSNDYRTITSGNWGINTSWERGTGNGWANCATGDFPDISTANVTIRTGHTIDNDGSGTPPWDVNNLTVETGGKLWNASFTGDNDYIQIYGNIICNGTIGNPSGDDISFDIAGGANTTISGSGSFTATRIRKDQSINSNIDANLIIDMNILLTWNSSSGTVLYNDESSSNFIITINPGKTLRGTAPGSNVGNISIDGANFSGPSTAQSGGTYTIHGTLDIDGILYAYNNNTTTGRSCNYLIKNGGIIKCRYVVAAPSGTQGNNLTIENGGKLNIFGSVDTITASLNDTTWRYYSTTNNTFNFQSGSIIEYSGATRQLMNGLTDYKNLIISGGSIKNMGTDISVDETLTLTNGIVNTSANKMIIQNNSSSSIVHNISNNLSFINGNLRLNINSNTDTYQLPIGYSNSSTGYHPANFLNGNVTGVNYIDASVNSIIESGNNVDGNLATIQEGEAIIDVINLCEWNITPDASLTGGNYGVDLFVSNMNMSSSDDNKFVVVKRNDNSTSYADWNTFEGTTFIPSENQTGRITNSGNGFARRTNFNSFSKFAIGRLNNSVLPITVYDFKVNRISKSKNLLEWKSNDEENLLYYELEKSEDGFNYQKLNYALPLEENNYDEKHYFVTDSTAIHVANYYKLFSVDNNGKRLYHDIAFINELKSNEDFSIVYSNDGVTVLIDENGVYTDALIYSSMGQLIKKFNIEILKTNNIQLNNSEFASGIYFIQLSGKSKTATSKLIIGK